MKMQPSEPVASPQATRPLDDRTPQDYAIEFGEYLAKAAEQFLEQSNLYDKAEEAGTEPDYDALSDCWRGLQSAIGEFRKRAKRAAQPAARTTPRFPIGRCKGCGKEILDEATRKLADGNASVFCSYECYCND